MTSYSPLVQLFFVIVSGAIVVLFIQPTVQEIRSIQQKTAEYQGEIARVTEVNRILSEFTSTINNISVANAQALDTYLPTALDPVFVMRDIEAITKEAGVTLGSLDFAQGAPVSETAASGETATPLTPNGVTMTTFNVKVETDYTTLKSLIRAFEINNYPLEVVSLNITPGTEDGEVSAEIGLATYSLVAIQE